MIITLPGSHNIFNSNHPFMESIATIHLEPGKLSFHIINLLPGFASFIRAEGNALTKKNKINVNLNLKERS